MTIRQVANNDFDSIYQFIKEAFKTAQTPPSGEEDFVLNLRAGKNYIPELELVAVYENEIIGHIMLQN